MFSFRINHNYSLRIINILISYCSKQVLNLQWKPCLTSVFRIDSRVGMCMSYICCKNENYGICPPDLQDVQTFFVVASDKCNFNFVYPKANLYDILFAFIYCLIIFFLIHNVVKYANLSVDSYENLRNVVSKGGNSYLRSYVLFNVFSNLGINENCCQLFNLFKTLGPLVNVNKYF